MSDDSSRKLFPMKIFPDLPVRIFLAASLFPFQHTPFQGLCFGNWVVSSKTTQGSEGRVNSGFVNFLGRKPFQSTLLVLLFWCRLKSIAMFKWHSGASEIHFWVGGTQRSHACWLPAKCPSSVPVLATPHRSSCLPASGKSFQLYVCLEGRVHHLLISVAHLLATQYHLENSQQAIEAWEQSLICTLIRCLVMPFHPRIFLKWKCSLYGQHLERKSNTN